MNACHVCELDVPPFSLVCAGVKFYMCLPLRFGFHFSALSDRLLRFGFADSNDS